MADATSSICFKPEAGPSGELQVLTAMSLLNSHFDCPRDDAPPSSPTKTDIKRDGCVPSEYKTVKTIFERI